MLLDVSELSIAFKTPRGAVTAVDGVSFRVAPGETVGLVGESGSGKSLTALAVMDLLPPFAEASWKRLAFDGRDLGALSGGERRRLRGGSMAMIFQDPLSSLNPSFTVGFQLREMLQVHGEVRRRRDAQARAAALFERVGIAEPERRLECYPHQLSGGMCQRVMIAMAVACRPRLLIADEPTTALDVTIQAQILDLLRDLKRETEMALVLITHDLAVVSGMADRVLVMYAGQIAETGPAARVLGIPRHPYTSGLLQCLPGRDGVRPHRLPCIPGVVPDLAERPRGCQFHPRCPGARDRCREESPELTDLKERSLRCHYPLSEARP